MTVDRVVAVTVFLLVAAAIAVGLLLTGSPADQRRLRLDERRVDDLRMIARAARVHWDRYGSLPKELTTLADGQNLDRLPVDPASGEAYRYAVTGNDSYRLCAAFAAPSVNPPPQEFWVHTSGQHCFDFKLGERSGVGAPEAPLP